MLCVSRVAFLLLAVLLLHPSDVHAQSHWGAVAIDEGLGAYGMSVNMPNRNSAALAALRLCRSQGAGACQLKTYFRYCAAIATDQEATAYGIGLGNTRRQAIANAVGTCNQYGYGCYADGARCNQY